MELTARLQAIADQVPYGSVLADIGTDHAYLPVRLLLDGQINRAIAADLREGPLANARETAAQYNVTDRISFRLCDGLTDIQAGEADVIAIAGMGGETIAGILAAAPWTRNCKLLLQPMTSFRELRFWLQTNGYLIEKETIAREGNRLYTLWSVIGGAMRPLSPGELWVGVQSDDPLRSDYLRHMITKLERTLHGHQAANIPNEAEITSLQEILADLYRMEGELNP